MLFLELAMVAQTKSGIINADTLWSGEIFLIGSIKVTNGATLTIAPGTNIIIESSGDYKKRILVDSNSFLVASSEDQRITFSSDNNGAGSWSGIEFAGNKNSGSSSGSVLQGVNISDSENAVSVNGQGILIQDCIFEGNTTSIFLKNTDDIKIINSTFKDISGGINTPYETVGYGPHINTEITGNTFKGGGAAIAIWPNQRNVDNLTIKNNAIAGTHSEGIRIGGGGYGSHLGDIEIAQNDIDASNGISVDSYSWINSTTPGLVITDNYLSGNGVGLGFGHVDSMIENNIQVKGNRFSNSTTAIKYILYNSFGSGPHIDVFDNKFDSVNNGIDMPGVSVIARSNTFSNTSKYVLKHANSHTIFSGNAIESFSGDSIFHTRDSNQIGTPIKFSSNYFDSASSAADLADDGAENFLYKAILADGFIPTSSYVLSTSKKTVDEGSTLIASVNTKNVKTGTTLYYSIVGAVDASDFTDGSGENGSIMINSSGKASFEYKITSDSITEGSESARILLYSDKERTTSIGNEVSISINDTSTTPKASYSLSLGPSPINEGDSFIGSITTTNVKDGTKLYYTIKGDVDAEDFNGKSPLTGDVTIDSSGNASFTRKVLADKLTEGSETALVVLYSDKKRTLQVGDAASAPISDASKAPKKPSYSLSVSPSAIDERDSFRASIASTNVKAGTKLYYSIKGDVDAKDFSSPLTGSIAINASGNASFTRKALADKLTEGSETARILLFSDQQRTLQVGDEASASISDTSKTPAKAAYSIAFSSIKIEEGDIFTSTIATKNIDPGTRLYWNLSGAGVNTSDFSSGSLKGSSAIDKSGEFTLTHALAEDKITEGSESLELQLFSDSSRKTLLTQKKIDIADTSVTQQKASLLSASVNASTLNLFFDSSLDNTKPNHNRFSITADGTSIDISSSSLNADAGSLKLNLASAIKPNQTVKLAYNDLNGNQASGVLQTPNGTDLASFSTRVSNNSSDSSAPRVTGATINGKVLSLSFDEVIAKATPSNRSWILKEDGKAISITSASVDSSSAQLDLTLSSAVDRGSNITLSYSDISGDQKANVIQDLAGNDLESFSNLSVENISIRSIDPLNINTAEINGNEVVLAFNRELSSTTPSKGTFRLRANNKDIKVKSITLSPNDREAVLKIASPVAHGDNVTLSYTDAQGNQKNNVIEDIDGNDLATISNFTLINNTRKSATDFEVDYADADGKIINLYLTDSLSSSIPKAARFRVTADKRKQKISSVSTSQSDGIITLNLKESINPKQDILISYRDLTGNQLSGVAEDTDGNDLTSFKNLSPVNDTSTFETLTDNNPPSLEDAYLDGTELVLEFDKTLQTGKVSPSRFKLRAGKKRVRVASALVPQDDDSTAIITLKKPLAASANSLSLTYKDLKGDQSSNIIQDDSGNDLASLRNFNIEII